MMVVDPDLKTGHQAKLFLSNHFKPIFQKLGPFIVRKVIFSLQKTA
jgi:hypothetical protein